MSYSVLKSSLGCDRRVKNDRQGCEAARKPACVTVQRLKDKPVCGLMSYK